MSKIAVDDITDAAGTGAPNFPNGATGLPEPFGYTAVSGATQALDVGSHNFFDAGPLTADTTVSFSNVPTEARWTYTAIGSVGEAFDLSSPVSLGVRVFSGGSGYDIADAAFKTGRDKLYVLDYFGQIKQYSLTNGRLNSAADDGVSISITEPTSGYMAQIYFKADGTAFYVVDQNPSSKKVFQYSLSTAWDLTTFSYVGASPTLSVVPDSLQGLAFSSDGTKMYVSRGANLNIYQYSLSSAWNVSSASYASKTFSVSEGTGVVGIGISTDGTKFFALLSSNGTVFQYSLSTPYDLSTASYSSVSLTSPYSGYSERGLFFDSEGITLGEVFWINSDSTYLVQYECYERASITFPSSIENPPSSSSPALETRASYQFYTADGGTTVWYGAF